MKKGRQRTRASREIASWWGRRVGAGPAGRDGVLMAAAAAAAAAATGEEEIPSHVYASS
jgi:hypothetical protein